MKTLPIIQGTPEWHSWRATWIGGSDSPAVLDESPYITRRELFLTRKGLLKKESGNEYIFMRGHEAEAQMRGEIFALLGSTFEPICIIHPSLSYFLSSLDGFSDQFGILETKLVGREVLKAAIDKDEIPRHHWIQMQHQFITADDVDCGKWFGSTLSNDGAVVDIRKDKTFCQKLKDEVSRFWEMLEKNECPPHGPKDVLEINDEKWSAEFIHLMRLKRAVDLAQELYESKLEELKGEFTHPKIQCGPVSMTRIERQGSISYAKIPEVKNLDPVYLESFRGAPSSYVKLSFKEEK
jgi:putative phage-type endonuclease